jgi:hypothetical protein
MLPSLALTIIREFCVQNGVTPAEVMREMLAHRRTARQQGGDQSGPERELVPSNKRSFASDVRPLKLH